VFKVEDASFTVYKHLVAKCSTPLKAMMEGKMQEARDGSATFQDLDKATFCRFLEFAHFGDYNPESSHKKQPTNHEASIPAKRKLDIDERDLPKPFWFGNLESFLTNRVPESTPTSLGRGRVSTAGRGARGGPGGSFRGPGEFPGIGRCGFSPTSYSRPGSATQSVPEQQASVPATTSQAQPISAASSPPTVQATQSKDQQTAKQLVLPTRSVPVVRPIKVHSCIEPKACTDYDNLPLLMSHAKLYVFADEWEIGPRCILTARRLDSALSKLSPNDLTEVVALIRYVYDNTLDQDGAPDILRQVVAVYSANKLQDLQSVEKFRELISEGGEFANTLVDKLNERLST
jgi:hypothetical protein